MPKTIEETRKYHREYYQEHREHLRELSRDSYMRNPEFRKRKAERSKARRASRTPEQIVAEAARDLAYQRANPEVGARASKKSVNLKRTKFNLLKSERPCYDCGGVFPPEAMDWDHRPGVIKCFDIGTGLASHSEEACIDEINKCQLVCANCHRIRTQARIQKKGTGS